MDREPEALNYRETVLLIHGTWANVTSVSPEWWQPQSEFCSKLNEALRSRGSSASCWADIGLILGDRPSVFAWTGANLESERRLAAEALADSIVWLEKLDRLRYHIVAHSHGGNVVLGALRQLPRDPRNLGAVIFLGTPVLDFAAGRELAKPFRRWGPLAMYVIELVIILWIMRGATNHILHWFAIGCLVALGLAFFLEAGRVLFKEPLETRRRASLYGSGHPYAFAFAHDEAIGGLTRTLSIMASPRKFVAQLLGSRTARSFAVPPSNPYSRYSFKDSWPYLTLKGVATGSPDSSSPFLWPVRMAIGFTAGLALIPECMILACDTVPHIFSAIGARVMRWLMQAPGAIVMGRVMRNAAVGADKGTFKRISPLPPEVERLEPISPALEEKVRILGQELAIRVGDTIYSNLIPEPIDALRATALAHPTDPRLAHSQYYREPEIIEKVAERIVSHSHIGS